MEGEGVKSYKVAYRKADHLLSRRHPNHSLKDRVRAAESAGGGPAWTTVSSQHPAPWILWHLESRQDSAEAKTYLLFHVMKDITHSFLRCNLAAGNACASSWRMKAISFIHLIQIPCTIMPRPFRPGIPEAKVPWAHGGMASSRRRAASRDRPGEAQTALDPDPGEPSRRGNTAWRPSHAGTTGGTETSRTPRRRNQPRSRE